MAFAHCPFCMNAGCPVCQRNLVTRMVATRVQEEAEEILRDYLKDPASPDGDVELDPGLLQLVAFVIERVKNPRNVTDILGNIPLLGPESERLRSRRFSRLDLRPQESETPCPHMKTPPVLKASARRLRRPTSAA